MVKLRPKIKYVPNILTISRIVLSIVLFFIVETKVFLVIYALTAATDVLDGWIARKFKVTSNFGASLGSLADLVFFGFLVFFMIATQSMVLNKYLFVLLGLFLLKMLAIVINFIKFKKIVIVHTLGNKLLGVLIFAIPFFSNFKIEVYVIALIVISIGVIIDEIAIACLARKFDQNVKSVLAIIKTTK